MASVAAAAAADDVCSPYPVLTPEKVIAARLTAHPRYSEGLYEGARVAIHCLKQENGYPKTGQEGVVLCHIGGGWWQVRWAPGDYSGFGSFREDDLRLVQAGCNASAPSALKPSKSRAMFTCILEKSSPSQEHIETVGRMGRSMMESRCLPRVEVTDASNGKVVTLWMDPYSRRFLLDSKKAAMVLDTYKADFEKACEQLSL